jgi:hypothetical protein
MDLFSVLDVDLDLFTFMDAIEVAALRALCKTAQKVFAELPEHVFDFTFSAIIPRLPKFTCDKELLWVIHRLRERTGLVQRRPCPDLHRRALSSRWRRMGIDPSQLCRMMHRRSLLESLVRAFWFHKDVQALLATAIRLDSTSLLRRLAAEAPGDYLSDDDNPNNDGTANFMYNVWVSMEEDHFQEHGPWEPLGRDDATWGIAVDMDLFFGKVHFVLWKYMAAVRKRQQRDFKGFCRNCDLLSSGLICDARCPR